MDGQSSFRLSLQVDQLPKYTEKTINQGHTIDCGLANQTFISIQLCFISLKEFQK